jgi:hypothetical protein
VAIALAFRVAIALSPAGGAAAVRVLRWSEGPGVAQIPRSLEARLRDPDESDADLTSAVSEATGRLSSVTTFSGAFETRKLQMSWSFNGGAGSADDKRVCTFHLLKLAGGAPSDAWLAADFEAAETAFDAFWASFKTKHSNVMTLAQYRWYKAGPGIVPPQEPVRVVDRAAPGTGVTPIGAPPQLACALTEKTSSPQAWGRVYLPMSSLAFDGIPQISAGGRYDSGFLSDVANAADTLYEAVKAAGIPIVVYSAAKPERPKKPSGTLPATVARALTVDDLQVDDIPDIIRSRRHSTTLLRVQRAVA